MDKEMFLALCEHGMQWFVLGSLISAQNNATDDDRNGNIRILESIAELCSDQEVVEKLGAEYAEKIKTHAEECVEMLTNEKEEN